MLDHGDTSQIGSYCETVSVSTLRRSVDLGGGVGYLKLAAFTDPDMCVETAASASTILADTRALVIDLRESMGGTPGIVELITYNLQALSRAIVVDETTRGRARPVRLRRIHEHFAVGIPDTRAKDPTTRTNRQGTGVRPTVSPPQAPASNCGSARTDE